MTLVRHELKTGKIALLIWALAIAFMMAACVMIYPEMEKEMNQVSDVFANMGGFTAAFGMDKLNFGEFLGFFAIECGNVIGIGGAMYAALLGIGIISKEEKNNTAEFLLTHPISRCKVVMSKLVAMIVQITILNIIVVAITLASMAIMGQDADMKVLALLFVAYYIMQLHTACICFGISAYISGNGIGLGLGLALVFYFINLVSNLTDDAKKLKYITPFGYTDGADIINDKTLKTEYIVVGIIIAVVFCIIGLYKYNRKDIKA